MQLGRQLSDGAICFEDRFCASIKGGIGEVGGFQHRVPYKWQLHWLAGCRKTLVGTGLTISLRFHLTQTGVDGWEPCKGQLPRLAVEKPWLA